MINNNFKKNQVVIFVIALMLISAGYLNYTNQSKMENNLLPTCNLKDSKEIASIGDAQLVNAGSVEGEETKEEINKQEHVQEKLEEEKKKQEENNKQNEKDGYFTQSKIDREKMYSQMITNYTKIIETTGVSEDERINAQNEIKKINNQKNAIMISENLIKTKGFEDVVIFLNNGNITVVIKGEKLEESQIAQIQNILTREFEVKVNKINISCKR